MKTTLYQYKLVKPTVVDGDTLTASIDLGFGVMLTNVKIRLAHINCPERGTEEGVKAKWFTEAWIHDASDAVISVKNHRKDKYGRILGSVGCNGQSLADALILAGHGVAYEGERKQ